MSGRIINHLLFANFIGGVTVFIQSLVPVFYIKGFELFPLYIIAMVLIFIALMVWIGVLCLRTSRMQAKYPPSKVAIGFGVGLGFFLFSAIFLTIYNFVADVPIKFEVIRNMIYMLLSAIGLLTFTSGITTLVLLKSRVQPTED